MSLQAYYNAFKRGDWATQDPNACPCRGNGWALSDVDTWHECPIHYTGQRHPEDEMEEAADQAHFEKTSPPTSYEVVEMGVMGEDEEMVGAFYVVACLKVGTNVALRKKHKWPFEDRLAANRMMRKVAAALFEEKRPWADLDARYWDEMKAH
jgi:hypothetical protein